MIKIIAFDLVGVLVREKDIDLTEEENKLERMFGPNIKDSDYLIEAKKIINNDCVIKVTKDIINKLYEEKTTNLFKDLKNKYNNIKIIIATNHLSYIKNYINKTFEKEYLDDIVISAQIHKIKPNKDFYEYLLKKYNISSNEMLFLDDNLENIKGAKMLGINTIKVEKNTNIFNEICHYMNKEANKK